MVRDSLPTITGYPDGQTLPSPRHVDFAPGQLLGSVSGELGSNAAVRAACVAGAGPSVLTSYAVADDITAGRLVRLTVPGLDLRRHLLAVWAGRITRPSGPARDLLTSILTRPRQPPATAASSAT